MEACYSQEKFNVTSYEVIGLVIISLQAFAGLWINTFIFFVLVIPLVRRKILNSNEKILLFLGCSRFWYFCFLWAGIFVFIFYPWLYYVPPIPRLYSAIQTFISFSNLWASSFLSGFYCIKIANFQHSFFTFLKVKIDRMVPWMLMGSALLSLITSILVYMTTNDIPCNTTNVNSLVNSWKLIFQMDANVFPAFFITGFEFATAFVAVSFSAFLLLFSLWRHKRRMQENSSRNVSVDAHIKAMKSILSFFFLYSINFAAPVLSFIFATKMDNTIVLFPLVFLNAFPIFHSLVLIFSNPKLEKELLRIVLWVKCKACGR